MTFRKLYYKRNPFFLRFQITHTIRHTHDRWVSPEQDSSSSYRPLPTQHTTNTTDEHPRPQRDSNPRPPQSSGRRPTPQTSRPLASACIPFTGVIFVYFMYHSARLKLLMHQFVHITAVCIVQRNKDFRRLKNLLSFSCGTQSDVLQCCNLSSYAAFVCVGPSL